MSLTFSPGNHTYRLDGKPVKGVTSLLSGGLPKPQLVNWAARTVAEYVADNEAEIETLRGMGREPMVNALKGVHNQKRDAAAVRGTEVHAVAERVVHGESVDVAPHIAGFVSGYVDWLDRFQVVPVLTERSVGNRQHYYAGRFDLVADMGGARWLLDVKTSKGVYGSVGLQLAAYRGAEFYVNDDDPDTEYPMPEGIERLGVVHVTDTGTTLHPFDSSDVPFRIFTHVAYLAKHIQTIDKFRLDPVYDLTELEAL